MEMTAKLIDGKAIGKRIREEELKPRVEALARHGELYLGWQSSS